MVRERKPNRLIDETSPYLKQHADNPVNWFPWGDEALELARREDKPIFLSIGYSACHWCHVMEHESFEDEEIADLLNRHFVSIKVDREERPDLDQIYMSAVTALSGHGGWPMSVFLTPELKPFYGGTYWPPEARMGMPGFREVLRSVHQAWETRRPDVERGAEELAEAVARMAMPQGAPTGIDAGLLENAQHALLRSADRAHGGFGGAPKFPHPMDLRLLLRTAKRFGSTEAMEIVQFTLDKMARGGIYDHLGGGFHRYSTDARWLVPHFEKMLYDNALLAAAYVEAYQATAQPEFARVVRETLDYVLREMTAPQGGFYSTQDADSEGVEGKFFVWLEKEIQEHLSQDEARIFSYCYDVTAAGNWEGRNILNRVKPHAQAAKILGLSEDELDEILSRCRQKLLDVRAQRIPPARDEKILVAWNGLMISAMALAARVLAEPKYTEAACRAADFLLKHLRSDQGRLLHTYKDGQARLNAYLDDYAALIDGLVEVYQATFDARYVDAALSLAEEMRAHFADPDAGGFFFTADDHESLIARTKDSQDGATPSGNSSAATALLKLGRLCGRQDLDQHGAQTLEMLSGQLAQYPLAGGQALMAVDFLLGPTREIVVVDGSDPSASDRVLAAVWKRFDPNIVVLRRAAGISDDELPPSIRPLLAGKTSAERVTVYVCERGTCHAPLVGVEAFEAAWAQAADPTRST